MGIKNIDIFKAPEKVDCRQCRFFGREDEVNEKSKKDGVIGYCNCCDTACFEVMHCTGFRRKEIS